MVKTHKNLLLQNQESSKVESWNIASWTQGLQVCSNDDPRLTFDLFTPRSNLHPHAFVSENVEKSFSQNVFKTNG